MSFKVYIKLSKDCTSNDGVKFNCFVREIVIYPLFNFLSK